MPPHTTASGAGDYAEFWESWEEGGGPVTAKFANIAMDEMETWTLRGEQGQEGMDQVCGLLSVKVVG